MTAAATAYSTSWPPLTLFDIPPRYDAYSRPPMPAVNEHSTNASVRTLAFVLCSFTAGIGGLLYASLLGGMSNNVNGGQLVLYAVAAAVIGGTSLFGGRGKMLHAVLGGLVVGVINNGLQLIGLSASAQLMWTAAVLLAAIIVDRLTRPTSVT